LQNSSLSRRLSSSAIRRYMIFVDGGYVRKNMRDAYGHDNVDYAMLVDQILSRIDEPNEIIRAYYYEGIYDQSETEKYSQQYNYLKKLKESLNYFEVRLRRLKSDGKGETRQKGVDTLIAIDMLSKAYEDHYDIAVLLSGDEDLLDVVMAVKNAGKRVYGAFVPNHISEELKYSFDRRVPLPEHILRSCARTPTP
jgi:uncharacterized LabA/DUF88 family protein